MRAFATESYVPHAPVLPTERPQQSPLHPDQREPSGGVSPILAPSGLPARGHSCAPVTEVMTREVDCVTEETSVLGVRSLFLDRGISGAPVVDSHGRVRGVVSKSDLVSNLDSMEATVRQSVGDIMTYFVFAVPSRASIGQAAALMAYEGVHRCVVTGDGGQITGIVTALDIARWVAEQDGYVVRRRRPNSHRR
jgi:CBS domain-containing protein